MQFVSIYSLFSQISVQVLNNAAHTGDHQQDDGVKSTTVPETVKRRTYRTQISLLLSAYTELDLAERSVQTT